MDKCRACPHGDHGNEMCPVKLGDKDQFICVCAGVNRSTGWGSLGTSQSFRSGRNPNYSRWHYFVDAVALCGFEADRFIAISDYSVAEAFVPSRRTCNRCFSERKVAS